ncbi:hypothetical protein [Rhodopirellula sp. SWK7]|uniref:hypothetical protein n=1 Tax=Rhodopirellula sp. SWK7 TaxID=595460 RepID=UPI0002BF3220|nr:hypothetical protein [Rhodopirellula sp. SWK7]EMI42422.1 hypothetical protein RRSWK_05034 [Rhodopirellula sp. SWK7]
MERQRLVEFTKKQNSDRERNRAAQQARLYSFSGHAFAATFLKRPLAAISLVAPSLDTTLPAETIPTA